MSGQGNQRSQGGLVGGWILIAMGVLFFLDRNFDLSFNMRELVRNWWPSVIILIGVMQLLEPKRTNLSGAYFMIVFGSIFQVITLGLFDWLRWKNFWPLAMIAVGVWMLIEHLRRPERPAAPAGPTQPHQLP
jgi:hypothetical protein